MKYKCFFALFAASLAFGVILPWIIRNFRIWGEIVTRTSLGIALYTSNNDCAEPSLTQELHSGCFAAMHPESNAVEAALRLPTAALLTAIFLLFPLLYYVVVSDERYRLPILWLSCLAAGYLLTALPTRRHV